MIAARKITIVLPTPQIASTTSDGFDQLGELNQSGPWIPKWPRIVLTGPVEGLGRKTKPSVAGADAIRPCAGPDDGPAQWSKQWNSRHPAAAARLGDLGVELLIEALQAGGEVLHAAGLPLREEVLDEVGVRVA